MIFNLFEIDTDKLAKRLQIYGCSVDPDDLSIIIDIIIIILVLYFIGRLVYKNIIKPYSANKRWRNNYIKKELGRDYGEYLTPKAQELFIDTRFQSKAPSDYVDPTETLYVDPSQNLLDFYLNRVLTPQNNNSDLFCVLAGSGMGKTTFSVNLLIRYIRKYKEKNLPFPIHLLSLSNERVLEQIESIDEKETTVLILDALDENTEAVEDFNSFIRKLETCIEKFKIVILTCRTQFFPDEESELKHSRLRNLGRNKGFKVYNKHYISPFSEKDIDLYLSKKYKWKWKKKKQAKKIVEKCNILMIRPLLLSYIDILVDYHIENSSITEVYDFLIRKWIERETALCDPNEQDRMKEELYNFSNRIAINIYLNKTNRGGLFITKEDFSDFLSEFSYNSLPYSFRGRSLLNRDSTGYIKFSHKSFLEFFLAIEMFNNKDFIVSFDGMDMVKVFYTEMCHKELDMHIKNEIVSVENIGSKIKTNISRYILTIKKKADVNFSHIQYIYKITDLCSEWMFFDETLFYWLETSTVNSVTIKNYTRGSLRQLLKIPNLKYLVIEGSPLAKSFLREAYKKGIIVYWNNNIVDEMTMNTIDAPLAIQLKYLMYKQKQHLEQLPPFLFDDNDD